jgi:hypothetical protein
MHSGYTYEHNCTTARQPRIHNQLTSLTIFLNRHACCIDIQKQQVALACIMLRSGLGRLLGGREMNEAVADVMRGAGEGSSGLRGGPFGATDDAVDGGHGMADSMEPPRNHVMPCCQPTTTGRDR